MVNSNGSQARGKWHLGDRGLVNFFIWPTLVLLILMNIFPLFYSVFLKL